MASPPFDINAPDPGASAWGPEWTQARDNIVNLMLWAAASGQDLPDWNTAWTYGGGGGELSETIMTYQTDTSIKMRWVYAYTGSPSALNTTKWYFDKGLGAGYELVTPRGTITYTYSSGQLVSSAAT
jgi:hypothetical protein